MGEAEGEEDETEGETRVYFSEKLPEITAPAFTRAPSLFITSACSPDEHYVSTFN